MNKEKIHVLPYTNENHKYKNGKLKTVWVVAKEINGKLYRLCEDGKFRFKG